MIWHQQVSFRKKERGESLSLAGEVILGRKRGRENSPSDVYYDLPAPLRSKIMAGGILVRLKGEPEAGVLALSPN